MSLTPAQTKAVAARGNVLVVAGAGTGKTSTLVERCLACLLEEKPPASLDEILMVTFTDAAAAEMRQRIRARLEEKLAAKTDDLRWAEQLALFETAHIGTLHSFYLQLLRQHFYELELDPQLTVLPEEEARLLADETLDIILREHYAGDTEFAAAVQQLIQSHGRGWDQPVRELVTRLHDYTQTLRDPGGWFDAQLAMFQPQEPAQWLVWLVTGIRDWRNRWLPALEVEKANEKAVECAAVLRKLTDDPSREQFAAVLEEIKLTDQDWPKGKKAAWRGPLEDFFEEAEFLGSLAKQNGKIDPLVEDWGWVRGQMAALLKLAREFSAAFADAKRELGMVDFHDLEQHALRLLWDRKTGQPTKVAAHWRDKLRFVFVDEYQDINDAQDAILKALSREGPAANRFLVGDVKQSIYRFRLADPRIFQNYAEAWRGVAGTTIPLVDNFRSREAILYFVNALFGGVMRREIGGVAYDEEARLKFGDPENRAALSLAREAAPRVELHLRLRSGEAPGNTEGAGEAAGAMVELGNLEEAGKEARLVALRLRELKSTGHPVWDEALRAMRPVAWGDMAVLLRSPAGKAETFAREFTRLGVPLVVARSGFYDSTEVADLLSLLQLLDNPLQDLPALAVLRSPLVGLSLDELAAVRLTLPRGHFWAALQKYHDTETGHSGWAKADRFLKNFAAWRRLARQVSLSRCLEAVLDGTHYADWLLTQPRGEQRHANVRRLLGLAQQFDRFQRQGLFRFLRFVEAQQAAETGPDVAAASVENSVSLMSIHQSKGLEFPVVVVADLGKPFNLSDTRAEIILDAEYGLCPQIKPPHSGQRYPSMPYWLARQRQKQESLGEELRLLYVAMTRARDTLILSGSVSEKKFGAQANADGGLSTASLLTARNYLDWIAAWAASTGAYPSPPAGEDSWWRWTIYEDLDPRLTAQAAQDESDAQSAQSAQSVDLDAAALQKLRARLGWKYPHAIAARLPAKTSVTTLRRQLAEEAVEFKVQKAKFKMENRKAGAAGKLSAAEIGTAHHVFLQLVALEQTASIGQLRQEGQRMLAEQALSAGEIASLDFAALAAFWRSELGSQIREEARNTKRELPFTARFAPGELGMAGTGVDKLDDGEFIVVQGVADLVVQLPEEIWLVDFKTDQIGEGELPERVSLYQPQIRLYALALERIYGRPVSRALLHFLALGKSVTVEPGETSS